MRSHCLGFTSSELTHGDSQQRQQQQKIPKTTTTTLMTTTKTKTTATTTTTAAAATTTAAAAVATTVTRTSVLGTTTESPQLEAPMFSMASVAMATNHPGGRGPTCFWCQLCARNAVCYHFVKRFFAIKLHC